MSCLSHVPPPSSADGKRHPSLNSSCSSSFPRLPIQFSPMPTVRSASLRLERIMSLMRSSKVVRIMKSGAPARFFAARCGRPGR